MAQFSNSRSEFMTSDLGLNDIEYERKGGFFMTHKKTALTVSAVVVIVIAAGFVGAYIGSIPKEKNYDTLDLIDGDVGCDYVGTSKFSLSQSIHPSRYRIELSPIMEDNSVAKFRGRVTMEFRYNSTSSLTEIVLIARRIKLIRTKLITGIFDKPIDSHSTREKRSAQESDEDNEGKIIPISLKLMENDTDDVTATTLVQETSRETTISTILKSENHSLELETSTSGTVEKNESLEIVINKNETDQENGFIVLYPDSPIEPGEYTLEIDYEVSIDDYTPFVTHYNKSNNQMHSASSQLKPTKVRNYFPLFDDVRKKARFSLTVPPNDMNILSNMPIESIDQPPNEWFLVTFVETPPIAPHNLVVLESQLEPSGQLRNKEPPINITFWGVSSEKEEIKYLMDNVEPVIKNLTDFFKSDFPMPKLDIVGLPHADYNSANPGLIIIQQSLFYVKDDSPKLTKEFALMNLIKLIGNQWLDGLVNTQNSSDVWILESSLLYLEHLLIKEVNTDFNQSTFIMDVLPKAMEADGYSVSRSLQSKLIPTHSNSFYTREAYAMGACLISMLHGVLRQTEFRAGYRSFVSRWAGGNADEKSFWEAITLESTEDEKPGGETRLAEVMNLWTTKSGYPIVTVTRNYETGSVVVHQARFSYDKSLSTSEQLWHIPLTWISNENHNVSFKWIEPQIETTLDLFADLSNNSWIIFNPTKSGYFRVNYDEENWKLIAEALRQNHEIFSPETRACLVDDVFSLAYVDLLPYSIVFDLIGYLPKNERNPEPWTYLLHHAKKLNLALYDSPVYFSYQEFMIKFMSNLYAEVGAKINEGSRLTLIVHELACIFDYPDYQGWAKKSFSELEVTTDLPIKKEVPVYLHKNLLCAFAQMENELGWQWWQKKFANITKREERNSLLSSLACFQGQGMLQAVLNEIVYSTSFEETDALVILESFSSYPAASQTALKFVESNWKNITRRYPKSCKITSAFLDASSTGFAGEKDIEDFQSFRDKNYDSLKKVGYVTALLEAKANASVTFLNTALSELQTALNNRTSI